MTANPWFRMYHEFATDPKVQMLCEVDQRRFVMLLCINAEYPDSTISDEDIAWRLRIDAGAWKETKAQLVGGGLITEDNTPSYDGVRRVVGRMTGESWDAVRGRIFERDGYKCVYCGGGEPLECDHVVPVTRGGDHRDSNLVTSCMPCNRAKRDRVVTIEAWKATRGAKQ